jgi:hypothetical protein
MRMAESYAHVAELIEMATRPHPEDGTTQDSLVWCMFYLWACENLEEA